MRVRRTWVKFWKSYKKINVYFCLVLDFLCLVYQKYTTMLVKLAT